MMMLLRRADNEDCMVPPWRTPTEKQLAAEIPLGVRRLRRLLRHLEGHRWLIVTSGRGRPPLDKKAPAKSKRSSYRLLPGPGSPGLCGPPCPGIHPNKRGSHDPLITQEKGVLRPSEKGVLWSEFPQVSTDIAPRDITKGEGVKGGMPSKPHWPGASHQAPDESWKSWPAGSIGEAANWASLRTAA